MISFFERTLRAKDKSSSEMGMIRLVVRRCETTHRRAAQQTSSTCDSVFDFTSLCNLDMDMTLR